MNKKAPIPETNVPFRDDADLWEWALRGGWIENGDDLIRWHPTYRRWVNRNLAAIGHPGCARIWRRAHPPKRMRKVTRYVNVYSDGGGALTSGSGCLHKGQDAARNLAGSHAVATAVPVTFEVEEDE